MSRRDDCLITTVEEATNWLAQYRHTIGTFDPQVLKVIECLESGVAEVADETQCQIDSNAAELKDAEEKITGLEERVEKLLQEKDEQQEEVDRLTRMVDESTTA